MCSGVLGSACTAERPDVLPLSRWAVRKTAGVQVPAATRYINVWLKSTPARHRGRALKSIDHVLHSGLRPVARCFPLLMAFRNFPLTNAHRPLPISAPCTIHRCRKIQVDRYRLLVPTGCPGWHPPSCYAILTAKIKIPLDFRWD